MPDREQLLAAALAYAGAGWPVLPCSPANKRPLVAADKDPATGTPIRGTGGLSKSSIDKATIRRWWTEHPRAMIGLAMGANRTFVLDFDPRHDAGTGEEWTLERLKGELEAQMGCALPPSLTAYTPSGGVHVWLSWPDDGGAAIRNRGNLPEHVDVRGAGGYVIAPPSARADGGGYRWIRGCGEDGAPDFGRIAEAPAALVKILRGPKAAPPREDGAGGGDSAARPPAAGVNERQRKYALAVLDNTIRSIEQAGSGTRNQALNDGAYTVARLVAAGALSEGMRAEVLAAGHRNPGRDDRGQVEATFESGWRAGLENPWDMREIGQGGSQGPPRAASAAPHPGRPPDGSPSSRSGGRASDGPGRGSGGARTADLDRECAFLPLTDAGNAERFMARFGDRFLYVEEWGWLAWDGRRWNREEADALVAHAEFETVRAIQDEAKAIAASGRRDELDLEEGEAGARAAGEGDPLDFVVKRTRNETVYFSTTIRRWGRTSEAAGHLGCVAKIARRWLTAHPADFDADPFKLNLANGTLEFRGPGDHGAAQWRLRPHDPADRMTRISEIAHDPDAACPVYDAFLARVQPREDDRRFLHAWAGYNMTASIAAQKLVFNYGHGSNGKSTWVDAIAFCLGEYATTVGIETFLDQGRGRKGGDATPDLADLVGRRMVRTSEPERGSKFADALIKLVTGGEPMKVRFLNKDFFEMLVTFKLTVSGNNKPGIGTDHGIWRRMRLMPWSVIIAEDEIDDELPAKLRGEASGILNRMIAGCLDWLDNGLPEPESMRKATAQYRESSDPLGRFLALCVEQAEGERVQSSVMHATFNAWALWAGEKQWSQRGFSMAMEDRGFEKKQSNTIQWLGVRLRFTEHDFVDHEGKPRPGAPPGLEGAGAGGSQPADDDDHDPFEGGRGAPYLP